MRRTLVSLALSALVAAIGFGSGITPASAAVPNAVVDDDGMAVPGNCDAATPAPSTIQAAVNAANPGDTILVCPGSYPETVTVNKSLTLSGAQAGVDARSRSTSPATESVVGAAAGAFVLQADNTTVDGFTITGNTNAFWGTGLFAPNTTSGDHIVNNYVHDNIIGMYVNSNGAVQTVIQHNLFHQNNNAGPAGGTALYSDQGLVNALVNANEFTDNANGGFIVSPFTGTTSDIAFTDNTGTSNGNFALVVGPASNVTIADNTTTGDPSGGSQVYVSGVTDATIRGNEIDDAATNGIRVDAPANTGLEISGNTLTGNLRAIRFESGSLGDVPAVQGNSVSGNGTGIQNLDSVVPDATDNWWGNATGPSDWSTGSGDSVSDNVDFFPWYTNAGMTTLRACDKTAVAGKTLNGTPGNDVLCGTSGPDLIRGKQGNDLIIGKGGADHLRGQRGNDALIGLAGDDQLEGGPGADSLQGRDGTDTCYLGTGGLQSSTC